MNHWSLAALLFSFCILGFELRALMLAMQAFYHLSHSTSHHFYFEDYSIYVSNLELSPNLQT
jgi:hypothetical protein